MALCPGLPRWAGTRKVKPIWILLKQETVSGSGINWAICKSDSRSRQITMPAPHHSVFTGQMPFLPPNQQRQSTEGISTEGIRIYSTLDPKLVVLETLFPSSLMASTGETKPNKQRNIHLKDKNTAK